MIEFHDAGVPGAPQATDPPSNPLLPLWQALGGIPDPCQQACGYELSILDLGVVNSISAQDGLVTVSITFTEPFCTFGFRIVHEIEDRLARLPGVREVIVSIDAYPLWEPSRLSDRAREMHAARRAQFGPTAAGAAVTFVDIPRIKTGGAHV